MKQIKSLRSRALDMLARREYSRVELQRKLISYANSTEELNQILDELSERNWQSDERFTEMWINHKSHKHGRLRLQQQLSAKGINESTIHHYLPDHDVELNHAIAVLQKKFKLNSSHLLDKPKHIRFLLYRGFSIDIALTAWKNWHNADQ